MSLLDRSANVAVDRLARELEGLGHPVRLRVVLAMEPADGSTSPTRLASHLGVPLGSMSYHVRCLADLELIELVGSRPRRGALEHLYELTARGQLLRQSTLAMLRDLTERAAVG